MEKTNLSDQKCNGCGKFLQQNGPFAHVKKEGESAHNGPSIVHRYCITEGCPENGKDFEVTL